MKNIFICLSLCVFLFSCKKEVNPIANSANSQAVSGNQALGVVYPHSDTFKQSKLHGLTYLGNKESCKKCHGENLQGTETIKSCNSCHSVYPHTTEFKTTPMHGSRFLENRGTCMPCHGTDFKGGDVKVACTNCHNYPHDTGWAKAENHGAKYLEISKEGSNIDKDPTEKDLSKCMMCHENRNTLDAFKQRHLDQFVGCNSCHADMPHGAEYFTTDPTDDPTKTMHHKDYVSKNPQKGGTCFSCHMNANRKAPKPMESCIECHKSKSQPTKWLIKWLTPGQWPQKVTTPPPAPPAPTIK